ncbi:MAG: DUF2155 domain-containing protein [Candidatus Manganitrophus sp.]|nr:DUF2155 domain-containing protein [Candidatus Manganitrophus morganii]MDC4202993.1 DUF2155 domain-containing protein [Candidatus Manganitrophus sp.]MCG3114138.1 DUF2155 domain-containing protein [Candidatus Manganitrophus morganii]WDT69926.1 MAG: DUF2155 domain-containing protein [Candidatus Manganitrophus sp.]WDT73856.1 MAG: DUF2155 domain-containing protein [Candidatus Manganitrophus sp.]
MKQKETALLLVIFLLFAACDKKEANYMEEVSAPPPAPQAQQVQRSEHPPTNRPSDVPDLSNAEIVIPDMVKGKWKAVKLMVEDKQTHQITEHTINLGEEYTLPDSAVKVKVGEFLPDLIIQGTVFTSVSNELKNPAVRVIISENGKELFKGWLFSLFPTMHPFQHPRFAVTLKDVVSA